MPTSKVSYTLTSGESPSPQKILSAIFRETLLHRTYISCGKKLTKPTFPGVEVGGPEFLGSRHIKRAEPQAQLSLPQHGRTPEAAVSPLGTSGWRDPRCSYLSLRQVRASKYCLDSTDCLDFMMGEIKPTAL